MRRFFTRKTRVWYCLETCMKSRRYLAPYPLGRGESSTQVIACSFLKLRDLRGLIVKALNAGF